MTESNPTKNDTRIEYSKQMKRLSNDLRSHNRTVEGALADIAYAIGVLLEQKE